MKIDDLFLNVHKLFRSGYNKTKISNELGLHRGTVRKWLGLTEPPLSRYKNYSLIDLVYLNTGIYSYLLGLYLGDGYINSCSNTFKLRFFLDKKYVDLNRFVHKQMNELFKENKISISNRDTWEVYTVYNNDLPVVFPQHGKGKKHERKIELLDWQLKIIDWKELMKGLFHSDGCFYKSKGRYFYEFKNFSPDIINIFKCCCEKNNIEYTFGERVIRIYKKNSVQKMKDLIGTKEFII